MVLVVLIWLMILLMFISVFVMRLSGFLGWVRRLLRSRRLGFGMRRLSRLLMVRVLFGCLVLVIVWRSVVIRRLLRSCVCSRLCLDRLCRLVGWLSGLCLRLGMWVWLLRSLLISLFGMSLCLRRLISVRRLNIWPSSRSWALILLRFNRVLWLVRCRFYSG